MFWPVGNLLQQACWELGERREPRGRLRESPVMRNQPPFLFRRACLPLANADFMVECLDRLLVPFRRADRRCGIAHGASQAKDKLQRIERDGEQ